MIRKTKGNDAEAATAKYLAKHGLTIEKRNFHCRRGELDIVARDQDSIVFVEVRARQNNALVDPIESVGYSKQRRLISAASYYIHRFGLHERPCRFDVIGVTLEQDGTYQFNWIRNAFDASL